MNFNKEPEVATKEVKKSTGDSATSDLVESAKKNPEQGKGIFSKITGAVGAKMDEMKQKSFEKAVKRGQDMLAAKEMARGDTAISDNFKKLLTSHPELTMNEILVAYGEHEGKITYDEKTKKMVPTMRYGGFNG